MSTSPNPTSSSLCFKSTELVVMGHFPRVPPSILQEPWKTGKSSTARQGHTSASFQFVFRVIGFSDRLVSFMGTHLSPHLGVMTRPTMMFCGMVLDEVSSTTIVLPGDIGTLLRSHPHTRCSCLARSVTAWLSLTVPIFGGHFFTLPTCQASHHVHEVFSHR